MDEIDETEFLEKLDVRSFQKRVLDWYHVNRRDLPWRGDRDPYRILVSEVMLQQTQVDRVKPKYSTFLLHFPTLDSLACASTADVLRAWQGLGYNRRALNLKGTAEIVARQHEGKLPETVQGLERLPGIGRYTARAIASFAFSQHVAVVDTNVRQVLSSWTGQELSLREAENLADRLLPAGSSADWNQALMDFGARSLRRSNVHAAPTDTLKGYPTLSRKKPSRGESSQPFHSTNRFWRGRIVDALRSVDSLCMPDLFERLPYAARDDSRIRSLVLALHEEGLVDYDSQEDTVSLPS